jgi:hypothetical protein
MNPMGKGIKKSTRWRVQISCAFYIPGHIPNRLLSISRTRDDVHSIAVDKARASRVIVSWSRDQLHGQVHVDSIGIESDRLSE